MKRLLHILLIAVLATACTKDTSPEPVWVTLSQQTARLRSDIGSTAAFTVTALGDWTLTHSGEGFGVSTSAGKKGSTTVTVTAQQDNPARRGAALGIITVRYTANGREYTLDVAQRPAAASSTMLLYMPGQDLLRFYEQNIAGIKKAVNAQVPGDGRILVCYQPDGNGTARLSEIYYDANAQACVVNELKQYTLFEAENPAVVQQMLADAAEEAPAYEYGLIIGCHGKAWLPVGKSMRGFNAKHPDTDLWTPAPGALQTRAFGDSRHELEIADLAAAITAQSYRLSYLIFDACFMANAETLYDLRHVADRIIASPCEIMGAGFPYKQTIPYLFTDGGTSYDLQRVCEEFWRFYEYDWNSVPNNAQSGCISLCETSELDALAAVMRRIHTAGGAQPDPSKLQIYEGLQTHLFYDLGDYVRTICKDPALLDEFTTQFNRAFPAACRLHTASFYSAYNDNMHPITYYSGVSLSSPSTRYSILNEQTAWFQATH